MRDGMFMTRFTPLALAVLLAACSSPSNDSAPVDNTTRSPTVAATDAMPASFAQCSTCHAVDAAAPKGLGPNLHAVIGRKAGAQEGFFYSEAMKSSGLIWDEATLDKYIEKPQILVPGNRMSYPGQPDAAKRAEIIGWLKKHS